MPAPVSSRRLACSSSSTRKPDRASISAAVKPPMPAPATMILREVGTARAPRASDRLGQGADFGPRRVGIEFGIVPVERRAIRTDNLFVFTHVEEDMGMVERRLGADAHELPGADLDDGDARIVVEMRNDVVGHGFAAAVAAVRGTIA